MSQTKKGENIIKKQLIPSSNCVELQLSVPDKTMRERIFLSFHEYLHPEGTYSEWKRVVDLIFNHMLNVVNNGEYQSRDEDNEENATLDEALSTGQVIKMYQCSQASQKTNTEKQPPKKSGR